MRFAGLGVGSRALWRSVGNPIAGIVSIQVDLWLRLDIDAAPRGGVLIRSAFQISEGAARGRRLLLRENMEGKSPPNTNEVHLVGTVSGVSHDDLFRALGLEFSIVRAAYFNPAEQSGATVSTVRGKDSYVIVSCS